MANVGPQQSWRGTHGVHCEHGGRRGGGGVRLASSTLSKNTLILIGWKRNKKMTRNRKTKQEMEVGKSKKWNKKKSQRHCKPVS